MVKKKKVEQHNSHNNLSYTAESFQYSSDITTFHEYCRIGNIAAMLLQASVLYEMIL